MKYYEITSVHMYSLKAFQWYQDHDKGCHELRDLNVTNKTKQNKQTSLISK
jgi:hypothetical protein